MNEPAHGTDRRLRGALLLVAAVVFLAALPGVWVRATYGARTTADEPHYLLTAISLVEDHDLDVADELAAQRYRPFHEVDLPIQETVTPDGRMLAPHDPLLPLLLAVPWWLAGWVGAKIAMAAVAAALAATTVWVAVRRFDVAVLPAALTVGILGATWPLSAHATQLYPEIPAALVTVGAVGVARGRPSTRAAVGLALLLSALPWLAVKYVPVAAVIAAVAAWRWYRKHAGSTTGWLLGLLALSGVVYLAAHQAWYGGWTAYAAGDHFAAQGEFSAVGFAPNLLGRARRLIGLLIGRDFGLAAWQPLWFLVIPATAAWLRRRREGGALVVGPAAAGWLTATFVALTMQGWWVPGRQVVVILPLLAIVLAAWFDTLLTTGARAAPAAAAVLAGAGAVTTGWLTVAGLAGRVTWVVDFMDVTDPLYRLRRLALPDYLDVSGRTWVLQSLWLVVAVWLAVIAWRTADGGDHPVTVNAAAMPSA